MFGNVTDNVTFVQMLTQITEDLNQVTSFQEDAVVEELVVFLEAVAPTSVDISSADAFLDVVQAVGDVATVGLAEDTVRHVVTPQGTELAVMIPSTSSLSSGFQLASVTVPPLQGPELLSFLELALFCGVS